jgi:lipopolysaccharide transport system permease protein
MASLRPKFKQSRRSVPKQNSPVKITSAGSQLQNPGAFIRNALQDLQKSLGIAKQLFLQSVAQRYRYSTLGWFWAFIPSAVMAVVLTLGQRVKISGLTQGEVPPQVYGIFGLVMAQTFLETLNSTRVIFTRHCHLLTRQKVPIEGLALASLAESIFGLLVRLPVLIAIFIVFNMIPAVTAPLSLFGFATVIMIAAGLGLLLAPWNVLSRDLESMMQFFPWFLFAATPVFVAVKPGSWLYFVYLLNPLTYVFEATRGLAYGVSEVQGVVLILLLPGAAILLISSWMFCRLCLPYIVERSLT